MGERSQAESNDPSTPSRWLDSVVLLLACCALYWPLHQQAVYGMDAYYLVSFLAQGIDHPYHLLYLRLVGALQVALEPFGCDQYEVMLIGSTLGTAIGVLGVHRAGLILGLGRGAAFSLAALCAVSPAIVFFATVVEIHGVFFAFAGLAWWALARLVRSPTVPWAMALGAATGVSSCVHATGHLLLGLVVLVFWGLTLSAGTFRWPRSLALATASAAGHALAVVLFATVLEPNALGNQTDFLVSYASRERTVGQLPWTLWNEWLWPFFPLSVLSLPAVRMPKWRPVLGAMLVALAVYTGVAFFMLAGTTERGAYFLPLVFPAALLTVAISPRPISLGAGALSVGLAIAAVLSTDLPQGDDEAYALGVLELTKVTRPFVLCADVDEVFPIMRKAADVPCVGLYQLVGQIEREGYDLHRFSTTFDAMVGALHADGRTFYFTRSAYSALALTDHEVLGPFFTQHLPSRYLFTPVHELGFDGYRMDPKP